MYAEFQIRSCLTTITSTFSMDALRESIQHCHDLIDELETIPPSPQDSDCESTRQATAELLNGLYERLCEKHYIIGPQRKQGLPARRGGARGSENDMEGDIEQEGDEEDEERQEEDQGDDAQGDDYEEDGDDEEDDADRTVRQQVTFKPLINSSLDIEAM